MALSLKKLTHEFTARTPKSAIIGLSMLLSGCGGVHMMGNSPYNSDYTPPRPPENVQAQDRTPNHHPGVDLDLPQLADRVDYTGSHAAGSIVVDTKNHWLYFIESQNVAIRYPIAVGRGGGSELTESFYEVSRKAEWPSWTPTARMHAQYPGRYPTTMPGGPDNPLGAAALYLGSTLFRIHGTNQPSSIGTDSSSGCIRMYNEHVQNLYPRVAVGANVYVLQSPAPANMFRPRRYGM